MKKLLLIATISCILISIESIAQSKYVEESADIRKNVWGWNKPEFAVRTIPDEYKKASKVIIARHLEINADTKKKVVVGFGIGTYRELMLTEISREVIKLNDKSSVNEYSEISYTQLEKRTGFMTNMTTTVYVGIKIIKPDGTTKEINADDVVLTRDDKKQKEAKIAVPDLQPGDIIDYFIAKQTSITQIQSIPPYIFLLYDDVPMMHCSMHVETGKKYAIEYRSYNGAPDFKTTKGDGDDNILDVVKKNIPAVAGSNLWTSAFRQLPMIRLNIILGYNGMFAKKVNARKPGEVYKNQETDEYLEDKLRLISSYRSTTRLTFGLGSVTGNYMKSLRRVKNKISTDSLARELFYVFRFHTFLEQVGQKEIDRILSLPLTTLDENIVTFYLGEFMKSEDVDNSMVYATSNRGPRLKEILSTNDLNNIIMIRNADQPFYGFSDIFTSPAYTPDYFENTKGAITVDTRGQRETNIKNFGQSTANIPGSSAAANARIEKIDLAFSPEENMLKVKRQSKLRGHYKSAMQKSLVLFEDYYNSERKYFNDDKDLIERLSEGRKTKKFSEELEAAFAEARKNNKQAFLDEISSFFEQEAKDLSNYKVDNIGARHTSPDLIYSSEFKLGGLVKKAGTSYIIDIGKMQGGQLKIEGDQRTRTLDIYAAFARSLQYEINFTIPDGYVAEGVEALKRNVQNSSGVFICEATSTDKSVSLKIKKVYSNAYEPGSNWNNMLAFIDAASEFSNAKIILKKK